MTHNLNPAQKRRAELVRASIHTDDERRAALENIARRRAELLEELAELEAVEVGHLEALCRDPLGG